MIIDQCIETSGGNGGHRKEDKHALRQRSEFMLQSWVVIAEDEEHEKYGRKTK
jgi:hypothetical protein